MTSDQWMANAGRRMRRIAATPLAVLALCAGLVVSAGVPVAEAADNQATGDIGGVGADLTDSNVFTLNTSTLALVKTAFLTDGTALTSGSDVPRGTLVQFLIYVENPTAVDADDINILDVLDPAFLYQAGTLYVDNTQPTGTAPAALRTALLGTTALDDGVDGTDVAGITGTTISAGSGAGNVQVDAAAGNTWAMLFTVAMQ